MAGAFFYRRRARPPRNTGQATPSADTDDLVYTVVINDEEQYSIWPTFRPV
ncbi:MbtH family NRPS accessory protein, partial [Burkholderia cenocepacia]|nr:MbtH family NRPS accessory protein [Burkholderia cenocepacia]